MSKSERGPDDDVVDRETLLTYLRQRPGERFQEGKLKEATGVNKAGSAEGCIPRNVGQLAAAADGHRVNIMVGATLSRAAASAGRQHCYAYLLETFATIPKGTDGRCSL